MEVVDSILSDYLITRHTGEYGFGAVVLYFSAKNAVNVVVTSNHTFIKDGVEYKLNATSKGISANDLKENIDNLGKVYYTTSINLIAKEKGPTGKASKGLFNSWDVSSPYLYKIEIMEDFSGGDDVETSADLIKRSEEALTVRNLVTQKAIYTVLTSKFSFLKHVVAIGMNSPEMQRDLTTVTVGNTPITVHRGSMIDIYCKFPVVFRHTKTDGTIAVSSLLGSSVVEMPAIPIYRIRSVVDNADNSTNIPYTITVPDKTLFLSNKQPLYLRFDGSYNGKTVTITYDYCSNYSEIQNFVASDPERTLVSNSLVKASYALYISFDMAVYAKADIDSAKMLATIQELAHSGGDVETALYVSTIVDKIVTTYGVTVQLPLKVNGVLLLPNGKTMTMEFQDRIMVPPKYLKDVSKGVNDPEYLPYFVDSTNPNNYEVGVMSDFQISNLTTRFVMDVNDSKIRRI